MGSCLEDVYWSQLQSVFAENLSEEKQISALQELNPTVSKGEIVKKLNNYKKRNCNIKFDFSILKQKGIHVFCARYQDRKGLPMSLPFVNETACENFTNLYQNSFKLISKLGEGVVTLTEDGLFVVKPLNSDLFIFPQTINEIMEGTVDNFEYDNEEWRIIPGGITSYFEIFADPKYNKDTTFFFEEHNTPFQGWYERFPSNSKALADALYMYQRNVFLLFKAMPIPEIVIITKRAYSLIENCRLNFTPSSYFDCFDKPLLVKGQDFVCSKVLEFYMIKPTSDKVHICLEFLNRGHKILSDKVFSLQELELNKEKFIHTMETIVSNDQDFIPLEDETELAAKCLYDVVEFIIKYRLLEKTEKTPLTSSLTDKKGNKLKAGFRAVPRFTAISLTKEYRTKKDNFEKEASRLEKEGKHQESITVSGYIREQAYGEKWSLRKTIWVDGFDRKQWLNDGIRITKIYK